VLNSRLYKKGNKVVTQLLVKWSGWPDSLATWEDEQAIKQRFPGPVEVGPRRRSHRVIRPNVRISGPEWSS
jgi:hypothetical protein